MKKKTQAPAAIALGAGQVDTAPAKAPPATEGPSKLPEDLLGKAPERPPAVAKEVGKARVRLGASMNAAAVVSVFAGKEDEIEFSCLVRALSDGVREVWSGDMRQPEAMLYGQAHALQAIFMNLSRTAARSTHMDTKDRYLRMALKAQNQCRMTLETLATIKNPPVVFTRQANINNGGQQQVNNGVPAPAAAPPAASIQAGANGLLGVKLEQWMDAGAQGPAGGDDPHLETVVAVHGAAKRRR